MDNYINNLVSNAAQNVGKSPAFVPKSAQYGGNREEAIRSAAAEYESVFLSQMMQYMFSGVDVDPVFGGGNAEKIFRTMVVDEYADITASAGGIGIAEQVQAELLRLQEVR